VYYRQYPELADFLRKWAMIGTFVVEGDISMDQGKSYSNELKGGSHV
jgi:hypothetical protein